MKMKLKPKYADKIIVGVFYKKDFSWYITERDWWILDDIKWGESYTKKGYEVPEDENYRFGISILDETSVEKFLENIIEYKNRRGGNLFG